MGSLLATQGWAPIHSPNGIAFDQLNKQKHLYSQIDSTEGWADYQFRLTQLREGTRVAIERGAIDAFGRTHEPEQRAVLYVLDEILAYVPRIYAAHAQMQADRQADAARSGVEKLYGEDTPMYLTSLN